MLLGFPAAPSQKEVGGSPGPYQAPFAAHFATSTGFLGQPLVAHTLEFASGAWGQMFMKEQSPGPEDRESRGGGVAPLFGAALELCWALHASTVGRA